MEGVTHAANNTAASSQWVGLVLDGPNAWDDAQQVCQIVGTQASLLMVRDDDTPLSIAQDLMRTRATSLLALLRAGQAGRLDEVLTVARSFASFRRFVVLRLDAESPALQAGTVPLLTLQDSPAVRQALEQFINQGDLTSQAVLAHPDLPPGQARASA